ncbi:MAG: cytochrome c biogenesis protein ResB [Desulfobulbus sp.]|jgi:cytochrome c biogenesis protein|nr:cytochrome c biogenesis protein ResB [Desulfobulbus sp.]
MTPPSNHPVRSFFASVQLALLLLFLLAATSIIGTIIPQNSPPSFYIEKFGAKTARLFQLLDITDMYNSWWFLALLTLFALNLVVCSLERLPGVIRTVRRDGLQTSPDQLSKQPFRQTMDIAAPVVEATRRAADLLRAHGWQPREATVADGRLLFAERGPWSRFGAYVVHLSILMILAGALVGSSSVASRVLRNPDFAFKGSAMLPEQESISHILAFKSGQRIDLGFSLRCDVFAIEYYPNGMPKTYRSSVTVLENGKPVRTADIEVNRPLTHRGVTFYQSSYQAGREYFITLTKQPDNLTQTAVIPPAREVSWPAAGVNYGIINRENQGEVTRRLKIWFSDGQGEPAVFWVPAGEETTLERPSGNYRIQARQLYATGLQAAKDPGVWLVYSGCLLMLVALYIAFFLSHRRVWVQVEPTGQTSRLLFAGTANKNRVAFEKKFAALVDDLENHR